MYRFEVRTKVTFSKIERVLNVSFCSSGQNLVPEPQDEAEAGSPGDARGISAASDGSSTHSTGSVPLLRQTATSVSASRRADAADDAAGSSSAAHDVEAVLLLKTDTSRHILCAISLQLYFFIKKEKKKVLIKRRVYLL